MATVDKNFRVKHGLVVEGSTATVNGENILREGSSDSYIINLIGGSASSSNTPNSVVLRDSSGNFAAGTITADLVGNVTGQVSDISNHNTDDLSEGTSNKYFTDSRAKSSAADLLTNANLTNITITGNGSGLTITAENGVADSTTDDLREGLNNLYFTNQRALNATSSAYDAAGSASSAQSAAQSYADTAASNAQSAAQTYADSLAGNYDAYGAASAAEGNANTYTNNAINALNTDAIEEGTTNKYFTDLRVWSALTGGTGISYDNVTGTISVDNTIANKTYVDTAINNLIDGAPGLLNTLNEIAAAINNDANFFTTIANGLNGKQNTLTAGSNIDITNDVISVTGLTTNNVSEGTNLYFTDSRAQSAVDGTDRSFTSLEVNTVSKVIAAETGNIVTAAATTAYSWNKNTYRSGKFTVKVENGSHTEISEILVTLDTSDNVAITEYGIVGTNGSLSTVTADVSGNDVRIRVTPANNNTKVMVVGTLI